MTAYIKAREVHAPKRFWSLVEVLFDGGPGGSSLAIGRWESEPVLAMRWNGDEENPLGNPQSRGLPTWFIVPKQHWKQILETEQYDFSDHKIAFARQFLELRRAYFLVRCPNPDCPDQERLVLHDFDYSELHATVNALEKDELPLYHIICDQSWTPGGEEKADLLRAFKAALENRRLRSEVKVNVRLLEGGLVECSSSRIINGRLHASAPPRPTTRDMLQVHLKGIGCGPSDDQLDVLDRQLAESGHAELWISQITSKFSAGGPVQRAAPSRERTS
jgi:hypothetical protein